MATLIYNVIDLQNIENDLAGDYELANDIDASATVGWNGGAGFVPITAFTGSLDFKGFVIDGLFINRLTTTNVGLFSCLNGGTVINSHLTNIDITGKYTVGGLAGYTLGIVSLSDCQISGNIKAVNFIGEVGGLIGAINDTLIINRISVEGAIGSGDYSVNAVGGVIGKNRAALTIEKAKTSCSVMGRYYIGGIIGISGWGGIITGGEWCSTGNITGTESGVGGLIGDTSNTNDLIRNGYSRGNVTGDGAVGGAFGTFYNGKFGNIYSTGLVVGNSDVGGLHGCNGGTEELFPCFWDVDTSGQAISVSGTGKTTAQMKAKATFTTAGWDFVVIWAINPKINDGYPFFWAMAPEELPNSPRRTATEEINDVVTLESIRNVELTTGGRSFINGEGKFVYKSRYARNE